MCRIIVAQSMQSEVGAHLPWGGKQTWVVAVGQQACEP